MKTNRTWIIAAMVLTLVVLVLAIAYIHLSIPRPESLPGYSRGEINLPAGYVIPIGNHHMNSAWAAKISRDIYHGQFSPADVQRASSAYANLKHPSVTSSSTGTPFDFGFIGHGHKVFRINTHDFGFYHVRLPEDEEYNRQLGEKLRKLIEQHPEIYGLPPLPATAVSPKAAPPKAKATPHAKP